MSRATFAVDTYRRCPFSSWAAHRCATSFAISACSSTAASSAAYGGIHDRAVPARDRLVGCLRQVLAGTGVGAQAREATRTVVEEFVAPEPTEEVRTAYLATGREVRRRVEYWLTVLANEGALPDGDNTRRARFLITVVNGLGFERALPAEDSILQLETDTLYTAVDCVLDAGAG